VVGPQLLAVVGARLLAFLVATSLVLCRRATSRSQELRRLYVSTKEVFFFYLQIKKTRAESQQIVAQRHTLMLTIPRFVFKSYTKDLSPRIFELIIRRRPTSILEPEGTIAML
jgi:hypothetical protein